MCDKSEACFDKRVNRAEKLLDLLISNYESYHSHKETMAHAGLLVMLALCGGIISINNWPPTWIPQLHLSANWVSFLLFFLLWLLLHIYIRWQLRNRRIAAVVQIGAYNAFIEWVSNDPKNDDLNLPSLQDDNSKGACGLKTFFDHIIPIPSATYNIHQNFIFPNWVSEEINKQIKKGAGSIFGEWLVTLGSFLVLIIVAIRSF